MYRLTWTARNVTDNGPSQGPISATSSGYLARQIIPITSGRTTKSSSGQAVSQTDGDAAVSSARRSGA